MLLIFDIVLLHFLIRVYAYKVKHKKSQKENVWKIRNVYYEYKLREKYGSNIPPFDYSRSILFLIDQLTCYKLDWQYQDSLESIEERRYMKEQPLGLYDRIDHDEIPDIRLPAESIIVLPYRYHQKSPGLAFTSNTNTPVAIADPDAAEEPLDRKPASYDVDADLSGLPPHPGIYKIIYEWFPLYLKHLDTFCRPPSYGPQAFYDFNRPLQSHPPPPPERENEILDLIDGILAIKPFQPIHFADTLASGIPLNTSASYHDKKSPESIIRSKLSSPSIYAEKQTAKGHFINTTLGYARTYVHNIKNYGTPSSETLDDSLQPDEPAQQKLKNFLLSQPTELFIRTQISKRDPTANKKIRPVYAVALMFILIEIMLTYCLLAQLRNPECAVMHGLETFRGSMSLIDRVALNFQSFVSLDWSQFDQRLPLYVIISYYARFLPRKIVISHGYAATHTYPDSRLKTLDAFAIKIFNLLQFLLIWYINMVFISYDGYAYVRTLGGVPSGLLNTQALDSYGNLYIILDCMLEFGFTKSEITNMIFFIMGDDNIFFARENFSRICDFMKFLEQYASTRHGMVLSILKSVWTTLRTKIEVLGYRNNYGMPERDIGKLVAQLAFPERPVPSNRNWMHAARAIGLAYASCGQDATFHQLCYMVYQKFKPDDNTPVSAKRFKEVIKYTALELFGFTEDTDYIVFPEFPSLHSVRLQVGSYAGFFSETDKWKDTIFTNPPSTTDPTVVTLADWLTTHPEYQFTTTNIWQGYP
uniref:RNA dependent RNA polymerase n=1 Tax=Rosellinia necatrix partitivirus 11 TaxID=2699379 RepID=A0A6F8QHD4_9VIRU|nr:RNA dependent RNA polymerase [Rosellinia necatrix partitivirus 11]